ncbi:THUMP-like domain-containing protein [Flavobacterium sp.]|uniref:THUMP-like domain-containing protein n=1 Tax=Flavobacterium sp. TaxID=239 RepID=UPI0039E5B1E9
MDNSLLRPEIQQFIRQNTDADLQKLALQKNPFPDANWVEILNQVAARTKAKDKLPSWFAAENIIYPSKVSVEQTSSEKTAQYKAQLVSGQRLVDLTGGFGVDDFYLAKRVAHVVHCEINRELSQIVAYNFEQLQVGNIECLAGDSTQILQDSSQGFDWIYIDPSRRNDAKGKVFLLKDCLPNVLELLGLYFQFSENILIKTAPILDISAGLSELQKVKEIHVVAVDNEVKELLWLLSKGHSGRIAVKTTNINRDKTETFGFMLDDEPHATFGLPQKYLYEPNAAIMKSGGFDAISESYNLNKLHPHSHLYTSEDLIDFPGRRFEIRHNIGYGKAEMKTFLQNGKANITTRNFPDSVETIRKKWKIKDGGNVYCFFTTDTNNNKIALICSKI